MTSRNQLYPNLGSDLRKLVDFMRSHEGKALGAEQWAKATGLPRVTVSNAFKGGYICRLKDGRYFYPPQRPCELQKLL